MGKKVLRIDYRKPVIVAVTDQGEAMRLITSQRYSLNFGPLELESRLCHAGRMKKPHLEITQNDKSGCMASAPVATSTLRLADLDWLGTQQRR